MLEAILGFFGEILLQIFIEALAELGLHAVAEPFRRRPHPGMAGVGYALFGAVLGAASLLVFPAHFAHGAWLIVNLAVTPVVAGLLMCLAGRWRARRGQALLRIDRFASGYLFALSLALVRYWFAN
jgi:hypothetical protein